MSSVTVLHALGLQMHQPPGNLQLLIETNVLEAQQIIHAYDRAIRYAHRYSRAAKLHINFSGILLEQLTNSTIIDSYRQFIDIPAMLHSYAEAAHIELIGTGYFYPIFPLMPREHWQDQLVSEQQLMQEIFGRKPRGFYAPEAAFCVEMIPVLANLGYEYVILEAAHIQPHGESLDNFKPYLAYYEGATICVIPKHRQLSLAQEFGLNPIQLVDTLQPYCGSAESPRLLTTWSNGENSDWLRNESEGFFQRFFAPYMEHLENTEYPIQPILLSEWLRTTPPTSHAEIHAGYEFGQWQGTTQQHHTLTRLHHLSQRYQQVAATQPVPQIQRALLEAESSCWLFWGESWLAQLHNRLINIENQLNALENPASEIENPKSISDELVQYPTASSEPSEDRGAEAEKTVQTTVENLKLPNPVELAKKPIMKKSSQPVDSSDEISVTEIEQPAEISEFAPTTMDIQATAVTESLATSESQSDLEDHENHQLESITSVNSDQSLEVKHAEENQVVASSESQSDLEDHENHQLESVTSVNSDQSLEVKHAEENQATAPETNTSSQAVSHPSATVDRQTRQAMIAKRKNSRHKK